MAKKIEKRKKYKNINRFLIDNAVKKFAIELPDNSIVLDIGAGGGHYRNLFSGKKYVAIDMGLEQSNYNGLDVAGDICSLPFKDATIDYALCGEVLEHVYEQKKFFAELKRVLKKGGTLLLTTPFCIGEHMQPYDFFRYTKFGLEKLLTENGLKLCRTELRGSYFVFLAYYLKKFPDYLVSSKNLPAWLEKSVIRILHPIFSYILPFILHRLDHLDKKNNVTLGYICTVVNEPAIDM